LHPKVGRQLAIHGSELQPVDKLLTVFLLATRNGRKTSIGAGSSRVLLATMNAQQAVAKRSVGRRVNISTCLFFMHCTALHAECLRCPASA
jgi:hypothetical protein